MSTSTHQTATQADDTELEEIHSQAPEQPPPSQADDLAIEEIHPQAPEQPPPSQADDLAIEEIRPQAPKQPAPSQADDPAVVEIDPQDSEQRSPTPAGERARHVWFGNTVVTGVSRDEEDHYRTFSEEERRALRRKLDWRLLPILCISYLMSQIDRSNIGNAKIEGMPAELKLSGAQWSMAVCAFFIPYIIFAWPSAILAKHCSRPSYYLAASVVLWGLCTFLHCIVRDFTGLVLCRIGLGIFESGFYPVAAYVLTLWYPADRMASRMAWLWIMTAISGAVSGVIASRVALFSRGPEFHFAGNKMTGWRYIFLWDGCWTMFIGFSCLLLPGRPSDRPAWLGLSEGKFLRVQHIVRQGTTDEALLQAQNTWWQDLMLVLKNWRLLLTGCIMMLVGSASWAVKISLPTMTKALGYSNVQAQLLSASPYVLGAISAAVVPRVSDRYQNRSFYIVLSTGFILTGLIVLVTAISTDISRTSFLVAVIVGILVMSGGLYPVQPIAMSWVSDNILTDNRRAHAFGVVTAVAAISGIAGSFMFYDPGSWDGEDGDSVTKPPSVDVFFRGFIIALVMTACAGVLTLVLARCFVLRNRKNQRQTEQEVRAEHSPVQLLRMGEFSPLARFGV